MTAVVVDGPKGKEYRLPTDHEIEAAKVSNERLQDVYSEIPFGLPKEPTPKAGLGASRAFSVDGYGFDQWRKLFTNRQLLALGEFVRVLRQLPYQLSGYDEEWQEAIPVLCLPMMSRMADRGSTLATWDNRGTIRGTFARYALPITWDYSELMPTTDTSLGFQQSVNLVCEIYDHLQLSHSPTGNAESLCGSAISGPTGKFDIIMTDPPYYDAIPYSDCMDYFYIWLRRTTHGWSSEMDNRFRDPLGTKWNHETGDGELIDDANRFGGDRELSKRNYEEGMARSFLSCHHALQPDGRLVVVFANKHPDAWETLVGALIRSGFVVDGSWPIQTEMSTRTRAMASAALASSVWLVCRKRPPTRPGWDNNVLDEMRENITQKLRDYWDAGIRGPDFVWAATGPALEAFSKHPVVKKANAPDEIMSVSEFLREVRRMVVDFVVGRVLSRDGEGAVTGLDDVTTYYLLHRNDFGLEDAPVGGCILYALSCNLSDSALVYQHDLLVQSKNGSTADSLDDDATEDDEGDDNGEGGGGAKLKLKPWNLRRGRSLGLEAPGGRPAPLIDQIHKLMHLWRAGDQVRVNEYLDSRGLQRNALFHQLLQALIELAPADFDERAILEALSNHASAHGDVRAPRHHQLRMGGVS